MTLGCMKNVIAHWLYGISEEATLLSKNQHCVHSSTAKKTGDAGYFVVRECGHLGSIHRDSLICFRSEIHYYYL